MTAEIGAPGYGITRRESVAATGSAGVLAATAGCTMTTTEPRAEGVSSLTATRQSDLPTIGRPEVVDIDERGGSVTLGTVQAAHHAHPGETMGGPVTLPVVWALQADAGTPPVPGPVPRVSEGSTATRSDR